ncbi:MAG: type II toxin-antitoxin system PemK/MazF family toxin [Coprobacillus sp.]|nr:type II toxin-antitoxin system PemK/MazF family toxin [Coprobacillus sp.]
MPDSKKNNVSIPFDSIQDELDWMKRQLQYQSYARMGELHWAVKKGEVYEIDWGLNVNSEFSYRHYGIVLADSNEFNPLVIMCPLKTNKNGPHPNSDIDLGHIEGLGTPYSSLAVVNQIRSIDKIRIYTKQAIGERKPYSDDAVTKVDDSVVEEILDAYLRYLKTGSIK